MYSATFTADDDVTSPIGGTIDKAITPIFKDFAGAAQIVASDAGDTSEVTLHYLDADHVAQSEAKSLTGQTPVAYDAADIDRLLKAIDFGVSEDAAVEAQAQDAAASGTVVAGTADDMTLPATASAVDGAYVNYVLRLDDGQIRRCVAYDGSTQVATVGKAWSPVPTGANTIRVSKGMVFEFVSGATPSEVRRPFYDIPKNESGVDVTYYTKVFFFNRSADSLTGASVSLASDPTGGNVTFALDAAVNGSTNNGDTRLVPPSGLTFDAADKDVPGGGTLATNQRIGVWLKLVVPSGTQAFSLEVELTLTGT